MEREGKRLGGLARWIARGQELAVVGVAGLGLAMIGATMVASTDAEKIRAALGREDAYCVLGRLTSHTLQEVDGAWHAVVGRAPAEALDALVARGNLAPPTLKRVRWGFREELRRAYPVARFEKGVIERDRGLCAGRYVYRQLALEPRALADTYTELSAVDRAYDVTFRRALEPAGWYARLSGDPLDIGPAMERSAGYSGRAVAVMRRGKVVALQRWF